MRNSSNAPEKVEHAETADDSTEAASISHIATVDFETVYSKITKGWETSRVNASLLKNYRH